MTDDDDELAKALAAIQEACANSRGYATFFEFTPDRDLEEVGAVESLAESLASDGAGFITNLQSRGRPNDPPDCEAVGEGAQRIAIEVTEPVSGEAIRASKAMGSPQSQHWDQPVFLSKLTNALNAKDSKYPKLKGGPYPGSYVVVIHTDEKALTPEFVQPALEGRAFDVQHMRRAFLLLSYRSERYPYFEMALRREVTPGGSD